MSLEPRRDWFARDSFWDWQSPPGIDVVPFSSMFAPWKFLWKYWIQCWRDRKKTEILKIFWMVKISHFQNFLHQWIPKKSPGAWIFSISKLFSIFDFLTKSRYFHRKIIFIDYRLGQNPRTGGQNKIIDLQPDQLRNIVTWYDTVRYQVRTTHCTINSPVLEIKI